MFRCNIPSPQNIWLQQNNGFIYDYFNNELPQNILKKYMAEFCCPNFVSYILNIKLNYMSSKKKMTTTKVSEPKTTYRSVGSNIYYDGFSYRVRMTIDGVRYSKNFSSKRAALKFRSELKQRVSVG